jgi:hypothetical protein
MPEIKHEENVGLLNSAAFHGHLQADLIRARAVACAREMLLVESVEQGDAEGVFAAVDEDGNGVVDVRELSHALAKWLLLVASPEAPLSVGKDLAMDMFIIFDADPIK